MMEDDVAGRVAGAVADVEGQLTDRGRVAVLEPAVGLERLAVDPVQRSVIVEPRDPERSASCGPSIGTPSSSAKMPADPQWSMWPWVSRIFSMVTPCFCWGPLWVRKSPLGSGTLPPFVLVPPTSGHFS